jgi:hypothetical protein
VPLSRSRNSWSMANEQLPLELTPCRGSTQKSRHLMGIELIAPEPQRGSSFVNYGH